MLVAMYLVYRLIGGLVSPFWLGFGFAFLNYLKLLRMLGFTKENDAMIKAKAVLDGSPE